MLIQLYRCTCVCVFVSLSLAALSRFSPDICLAIWTPPVGFNSNAWCCATVQRPSTTIKWYPLMFHMSWSKTIFQAHSGLYYCEGKMTTVRKSCDKVCVRWDKGEMKRFIRKETEIVRYEEILGFISLNYFL